MTCKSKSAAMLPNPRQKTAEHDGVSQPLLEMDKQVFVVNWFTAPERFCMVLFAGVGLKAVLEVGPTQFELALLREAKEKENNNSEETK